MEFDKQPERNALADLLALGELDELVFGLRWDSPQLAGPGAVDLDAMCVLLDAGGHVIQIIDGTHPRSEDESVIHTGDSLAGASTWDDERVFVFLRMLRPEIASLEFYVVHAGWRTAAEPISAFCHISDPASERMWARFELPPLSESSTCVATVRRRDPGWEVVPGTP